MKKNLKTLFLCKYCGCSSPKWMGRCPDCGEWDSFSEEIQTKTTKSGKNSNSKPQPIPIDSVEISDEGRFFSGITEFDRVLGCGLVPGTLVLIGGEPGIGKSTLMLQAIYGFAKNNHKVLYVSGEESIQQIKIRSDRIGASSGSVIALSEVDMGSIIETVESICPQIIVIDSIQTMFCPELSSTPGTVSQIREAASKLMLTAKTKNTSVFLIGHVTKEGTIAGPKLLEHMVDTVLYFEGDQNQLFRILRAVKNRFGSTNEIGVFEMKEKGLEEVLNPSSVFLSERPDHVPGSIVTACMEGTRPILVEIQALASITSFGTPRRTVLGIDSNRVALLVAVIEKKLGMHLMGFDIFMNVAGGVRIDEPAVDLGIVSAVVSSFLDRPIIDRTIVLGEVGLTGEVRAISHIDARVSESKKMGFNRLIVPEGNAKRMVDPKDIEIIGIKTLPEAIDALFEKES
ncbi:MAG: DNA repair protein RadA [Desulfobacterales bacterium]|nr:DNA repair protein RadA [Desulfobacterales bacterium]